MNQQQKIEEARAFLNGSHLGKSTFRELDRAILIIRDLLAVFEEAHTLETVHSYGIPVHSEEANAPTADEREALVAFMRRVNPVLHGPLATVVAEEWAEKFIEEFGFHRTVQGEPSDEEIEAARYRERLGDLEGADDEVLAHTLTSSERPKQQGEPSDAAVERAAAVLAMFALYGHSGTSEQRADLSESVVDRHRTQARAALRAAAEAERESRGRG